MENKSTQRTEMIFLEILLLPIEEAKRQEKTEMVLRGDVFIWRRKLWLPMMLQCQMVRLIWELWAFMTQHLAGFIKLPVS